ncbi:MAG: DUF58 domain-containing protein, partial [Bacteroidetes bacterium]|nr:DUF58 domain-containing protein [Bacteroidota bacterium]
FIIGLHKSPFHGFSVEFAEHRPYQPGQLIKDIDWKVYGRTDKLFVKRFEEETNLRCQLIIDASSSMFYPRQDFNKIKFSLIAAAALQYLLKKQRDAVGLTIFDEDIIFHSAAKSNNVHHKLLNTQLEQLMKEKPKNKGTNVSGSLHKIAEMTHKRSMIVIFSDMFDPQEQEEELFSALQHLKHNKHEVILFHVVDKQKELDFEFENRPYIFVDVETQEKVKLHTNEVRDYYIEQMKKFKKQLIL